MAQVVVAQRMWQRRDVAANWTAKNPVLAAGEIGVELGATASDPQKFKIGNGATPWNTLAYGGGGGGGAWLNGSDAPANTLGNDGDYYLRTSNGAVYAKTSGAWAVVANITGPAGTAGSQWLNGSGAPAAGLGANGDYYLRTSNDDVYAKASGTWTVVANLRGAPGVPGEPGAPGVAGPPGPSSSCFPTFNVDGGTGVIAVGAWAEVYVPFGFTIRGWALGGDVLGTLAIDIRVAPYADYPPEGSDSICGSNPPALAGDNKARSSTLTGWSVDVPSGSFLRFYVAACAGITKATLTLEGERN